MVADPAKVVAKILEIFSSGDSEIIVLIGENPTGKTTLLQMIAGSIKPDEGSGEVFPMEGFFKLNFAFRSSKPVQYLDDL